MKKLILWVICGLVFYTKCAQNSSEASSMLNFVIPSENMSTLDQVRDAMTQFTHQTNDLLMSVPSRPFSPAEIDRQLVQFFSTIVPYITDKLDEATNNIDEKMNRGEIDVEQRNPLIKTWGEQIRHAQAIVAFMHRVGKGSLLENLENAIGDLEETLLRLEQFILTQAA